METFKYSLDKSSKKNLCPNCNKNTFVYYVNTETGNYLTTDFGRCDREQNCNYHKAPPKGKRGFLIPFLTLQDISNKAFKLVDVNGIISIIPKSQILEQQKGRCYISEWYLKTSTINYLNNESKYFNTDEVCTFNEVKTIKEPQQLKSSFHRLKLQDKIIKEYKDNQKFDNLTTFLLDNFTFDEVDKAVSNYYLTGSNYCWQQSTIFWQIDDKGQIRGAKIMLYDKVTGKRIKEPYNHINWLHKAIKEPDFNLCQCLFGLHLINEDCQKSIAIVESEKTAIIMSIFLPEFIWVSTGSKSNFKFEVLEPLKKRKCFAFPDKGEFNNWSNKAKELKTKGFKIEVSNIIEQTNFNNGFDLADYYFKTTK
ncbi:DUF6371 domain-containing protein [Polaribacter glomeratus]|nr:DUF6371 domain-containing protein [Polaribacter glomeratus]TXD67039.1 hypothetical protein ESX12_00135 [Polaribacter glomeratus]